MSAAPVVRELDQARAIDYDLGTVSVRPSAHDHRRLRFLFFTIGDRRGDAAATFQHRPRAWIGTLLATGLASVRCVERYARRARLVALSHRLAGRPR